MTEYRLGINISALKDNEPVAANAGGKDFAIVKIDGKIHALDGVCTHKGGPLGKGMVNEGRLVCPWHGGAFEIDTGRADESTPWVTDINVYRVRVDSTDGEVYIDF
ncbi:MAG: Rieske 2Fe-2S domain-containing protein [Candidatus Micrarchaeota archaeon]|nr:Rieske 2Fe-2S domain-containing protein [Candidatus Micrarchaeota archaeon]MDE1859929.1 Rieske 2Fe-2S domain-containing protein [Candidatus Micrarchaeota archaeon]